MKKYIFIVAIIAYSCSLVNDKSRYTRQASSVSPINNVITEMADLGQIPTPIAGTGVVTGYVSNQISDIELFLAEHIGRSDQDHIYGLDINKSQKAVFYGHRFVFVNVKPGKYMIIAWNPAFSYSIKEIIVEAGSIVDTGEIIIP